MKIDYAGRTWEFSLEDMTVAQCEALEKYIGKGLGEWSNQMAAGAVKAVVGLWWVIQKQGGADPGPISQPGDDFRPVRLLAAFNTALKAEDDERAAAEPDAAEPDPTRTAAPSSPGSAATTTTPAGAVPSLSRPG